MRKRMILLGAMTALAGCGSRSDEGNVTARLGNSVDRLAESADNWGDNASNSVDAEGPGVQNAIGRANGRLADLVGRATGTLGTDDWIGKWRGVEGTNLVIAKAKGAGAGHYRLTMQYTLDDHGTFDGVAEGGGIRFQRPDGAQSLHATDGKATGLKYLADKKDCLTVKQGEGYCRD